MIGLGVGIDYSLFIVTRFRQLLHEGLSPADAAAEAGASAGRAVLFAGLTVAISVTGLAFFGLDFEDYKLGIGSALGVLTTVLIANSLLIAVLAKLGHKIDRLKVPFLRPLDDSEAARERTPIARWGRFVTANAKAVFVILLVAGLVLASTSALVRLGASDQGTQPDNQTARRAYDLLAEGFGPASTARSRSSSTSTGRSGPAADLRARQGPSTASPRPASRSSTMRRPSRSSSSPPVGAPGRGNGQLVDRLRGDVVPEATTGSTAVVYVSGLSAAFKDIADRIMERLLLFLLYIIGVTFLVLAMAFRSIVISLTAAITTIFSAFIGFGVLTLIVQEGYLLGLTGSTDRADRDVRPTDRVRDLVRPLDGLHGLPDEPHPRGARPRPPGPERRWSMGSRRSGGSSWRQP